MKKRILFFSLILPFAAMSQTQPSKAPYTAAYSSKFVMASPSYANKVLNLWKDFENNTLDNHLNTVSDTVTMMFAEGKPMKGKAEALAGAKAFRNSIKDYKVTVEAWMSVKSVDKGENAVTIWGNEDYTDKDGNHITHRLHEVWIFNKAGKVALMMQYAGA